MQQVTLRQLRLIVFLAIVSVLLLFTSGCGWNKTMTFPSPSGNASVEVWQTGIANEYGIRVDLATKWGRTELFERRGESIVYLVHVYWSSDETIVGVLGTGSTIFGVGFDLKSGRPIPFEHIRQEVGESIRQTYQVPENVKDPVRWAAMHDAQTQFWAMHPEIHVTYREDVRGRN